MLDALGRVLQLDSDQRSYLYELAGQSPARRPRRRPAPKVRPYMQRILDHLSDTPAMVATPTMDILAWNPLAAALMIDFGEIPERERNFLRLIFTDPRMRNLYPEWEDLARATTAYVRMEAANKRDDPRLTTLVGELSLRNPQFRQWWAGHHVAIKRRGSRNYNHPLVGEITLDWDTLTSNADQDQQIIIFTAAPGSASEQALRILGSRSTHAGEHAEARSR